MKLSVTQPANFGERVFLLEAVLTAEEVSLSGGRFVFPMPEFPKWLFRGIKEPDGGPIPYSYPPVRNQEGELTGPLGLFENGLWEFILQSNGCAVEENPDLLEDVVDTVRRSIQERIDSMRE